MRPRSLRSPRSSRTSLPPLPWRRWRRRARRAGALWWLLAAAGLTVGAARVAGAEVDAVAARDAWGATVTVAVAAHDLEPGHALAAGDATVAEWPAAVVPDGALAEVPLGAVVTAQVLAGEALVPSRVGAAGLSAVAARVPAGHRAIALPVDGGAAFSVAAGDLVDVLATFDVLDPTDGSSGPAPTGVVAHNATVVDVGDRSVTVAVPEADAPRVAFAAARGTVTLALVGAG